MAIGSGVPDGRAVVLYTPAPLVPALAGLGCLGGGAKIHPKPCGTLYPAAHASSPSLLQHPSPLSCPAVSLLGLWDTLSSCLPHGLALAVCSAELGFPWHSRHSHPTFSLLPKPGLKGGLQSQWALSALGAACGWNLCFVIFLLPDATLAATAGLCLTPCENFNAPNTSNSLVLHGHRVSNSAALLHLGLCSFYRLLSFFEAGGCISLTGETGRTKGSADSCLRPRCQEVAELSRENMRWEDRPHSTHRVIMVTSSGEWKTTLWLKYLYRWAAGRARN